MIHRKISLSSQNGRLFNEALKFPVYFSNLVHFIVKKNLETSEKYETHNISIYTRKIIIISL